MRKTEAKALAAKIVSSITTASRLEYMQRFIAQHPDQAEAHADYIQWLERLLNEGLNRDYSNPATNYGAVMHFKAMAENEAVEELSTLCRDYGKGVQFTEAEVRQFYREVQAMTIPPISEQEWNAMYNQGSTPREFLGVICDELGQVAGDILWQYTERQQIYKHTIIDEDIEEAVEEMAKHEPDVLHAILQACAVETALPVNTSSMETQNAQQMKQSKNGRKQA